MFHSLVLGSILGSNILTKSECVLGTSKYSKSQDFLSSDSSVCSKYATPGFMPDFWRLVFICWSYGRAHYYINLEKYTTVIIIYIIDHHFSLNSRE